MVDPTPLHAEPTQRRADAAMYARVFIQHAEGAIILADLVARFHDRAIFVAGGPEGARQTDFNAGKQSVIRWLLAQLNQLPENTEEN